MMHCCVIMVLFFGQGRGHGREGFPVCGQVSAIAEELLKTEYDAVRIIFNRFQSAISFKPTIATVLRCSI